MTRLSGFSPLVRHMIQERATFYTGISACEIQAVCLGAEPSTHHHRRPRGAGGSRRPETNQAANGLATCDACHSWVESNRKAALEAGWLVSQHRKPAEIPVLHRGHWVLLSDAGDIQQIPEPAGGKVA